MQDLRQNKKGYTKKIYRMTPTYIIALALSLSFCYTEYANKGLLRMLDGYKENPNSPYWFFNAKPFTCFTCMTGWFGLIVGCIVYGWVGVVFLPVGVFAGAVFSVIRMRWL